jgi:hypothetical protein
MYYNKQFGVGRKEEPKKSIGELFKGKVVEYIAKSTETGKLQLLFTDGSKLEISAEVVYVFDDADSAELRVDASVVTKEEHSYKF